MMFVSRTSRMLIPSGSVYLFLYFFFTHGNVACCGDLVSDTQQMLAGQLTDFCP
jgi:hypothetical protein